MDAFVFRRSGTTYYLVAASDAHAFRQRGVPGTRAELSRVPAVRAGWLIEDFCRSPDHAARLGDHLVRRDDFLVGGVDPDARRALLERMSLELRKGNSGAWQLFSHERRPLGVLLELAEQLVPAEPPDQTFGWIEFDLLDQHDQPIGRVPWALKRGGETVRDGVLNAQGNAYADDIEPGTYTIVIGEAATAKPVEPSSWLGIELFDDFGFPVAGEPYRVTDAAGGKHEGVLDASGRATLLGLPPGTCELTFTRLDTQAWAPAQDYQPPPPATRARAPEPVPLPPPPPREIDDGSGARKDRAHPVGAAHFQLDSAFPGPDIFDALDKMHAASEVAPGTRLVVFGHADQQGSDDYNKRLSDRRARAVLALLTQDLEAFDKLAADDEWRLIHYQSMLAGLGVAPVKADDVLGPQTKAATKAFQQAYNKHTYHPADARPRAHDKLGEDGVLGPKTKQALHDAYLSRVKRPIAPERFIGPKFAGCGEFNALSYVAAANRRVSLAVFEGTTPRAQSFPCKEGDAKQCPLDLTQAKSLDAKRRVPPRFRCSFYRKHLEESYDKLRVPVLDISDANFRTNRAVLVPGPAAAAQATDATAPISFERGLANLFKVLQRFPKKRVLVAGHTDSVGSEQQNDELSAQRAHSVLCYLAGKKDDFVEHAHKHAAAEDYQQALAWVQSVKPHYGCDPGTIDNDFGKNSKRALIAFKKAVNAELNSNLAADDTRRKDDWAAFYDVYDDIVSSAIELEGDFAARQKELNDRRKQIVFTAPAAIGCGERYTVERAGEDAVPSKRNRRVDVLLFDEDGVPEIAKEPPGEAVYGTGQVVMVPVESLANAARVFFLGTQRSADDGAFELFSAQGYRLELSASDRAPFGSTDLQLTFTGLPREGEFTLRHKLKSGLSYEIFENVPAATLLSIDAPNRLEILPAEDPPWLDPDYEAPSVDEAAAPPEWLRPMFETS